jgi:Holliday junction resolvasome RuvABC endonuclease subunit
MYVIGIDPAETTGIALLKADGAIELVSIRTLRIRYRPALSVHEAVGRFPEGAHVAIEDQFLGDSPSTLMRLVEHRTRWQQEAEAQGHQVALVAPRTWRTILRGMPGVGAIGTKRAAWKAAAQDWCRRVFSTPASEDEADAICIAYYYATALRRAP